jgi:hypothetical protein
MPVEGNIEGRKLDLKVSVDRSAEIEELQRQLEDMKSQRDVAISEKEQMEADLSLIAEKEFVAKCKSLGLNPATTTIETLREKEFEKMMSHPAPAGEIGSTIILNDAQMGITRTKILEEDEGYDSYESMILDLSKKSKSSDIAEAVTNQAIMNELAKKVVKNKQPLHIELESGITGLARKPSKLPTESQENYEKRMDNFLKRQKWSNVKGDD